MEPAVRAQSVHALRSLPPTAVARGPEVDHAISAARLCKSSSWSRRSGASDAGTIGVRAKRHATDALQRKVCDAMLRGCASSSRSWRREASDAARFVRAKEHAASQWPVMLCCQCTMQAVVSAGDGVSAAGSSVRVTKHAASQWSAMLCCECMDAAGYPSYAVSVCPLTTVCRSREL
jgi:hypothetical protein